MFYGDRNLFRTWFEVEQVQVMGKVESSASANGKWHTGKHIQKLSLLPVYLADTCSNASFEYFTSLSEYFEKLFLGRICRLPNPVILRPIYFDDRYEFGPPCKRHIATGVLSSKRK